jgi:hypothetical protein
MSSKKADKNISDYCQLISQKFNLDAKVLLKEWDDMNKESVVQKSTEKSKEITIESVNCSTVPMLAAMCEAKGLKKSGKKDELIARLLDCLKKEKNGEPVVTVTEKKTLSKSVKEDKPVITALKKDIPNFSIKKNSFGNFEHLETHLIFTVVNGENIVTGVQQENGEVFDLSVKDIDLCHKFKFKYLLPKNLNSSKTLEETKNDEIDAEDLDMEDPDLDEPDLDDEELEEEL